MEAEKLIVMLLKKKKRNFFWRIKWLRYRKLFGFLPQESFQSNFTPLPGYHRTSEWVGDGRPLYPGCRCPSRSISNLECRRSFLSFIPAPGFGQMKKNFSTKGPYLFPKNAPPKPERASFVRTAACSPIHSHWSSLSRPAVGTLADRWTKCGTENPTEILPVTGISHFLTQKNEKNPMEV